MRLRAFGGRDTMRGSVDTAARDIVRGSADMTVETSADSDDGEES